MNWLLQRVVSYARARLLEASTWRNLILLVGGSWAAAHPEFIAAAVPVCIALAGAIGSFLPDFLGGQNKAKTDDQGPTLPPIELQGRADPAADAIAADRMRYTVPAGHLFVPEHDERGGDAGWNG